MEQLSFHSVIFKQIYFGYICMKYRHYIYSVYINVTNMTIHPNTSNKLNADGFVELNFFLRIDILCFFCRHFIKYFCLIKKFDCIYNRLWCGFYSKYITLSTQEFSDICNEIFLICLLCAFCVEIRLLFGSCVFPGAGETYSTMYGSMRRRLSLGKVNSNWHKIADQMCKWVIRLSDGSEWGIECTEGTISRNILLFGQSQQKPDGKYLTWFKFKETDLDGIPW